MALSGYVTDTPGLAGATKGTVETELYWASDTESQSNPCWPSPRFVKIEAALALS